MRNCVLIASPLLPVSAQAQVLIPSAPPPAVNQEGMKDFCITGTRFIRRGRSCASPIRCRHALRGERRVEIQRGGRFGASTARSGRPRRAGAAGPAAESRLLG